MRRLRITTNLPVRYGKWPAAPTRKVGPILQPGQVLEIPAKDERFYRFVATEGIDTATITMERTEVVR